ncbi:2TM domain-containing protein [Blastococcus sp. VKM Ac-2987]|uniref:2TM domain-containing protein n=1 Tax=Blastococcus sp. VKM Ac-2987 TaxID=3004141 RepID=UPI0022ABABBD|nr:2TM domain-containing protein [Blastococcus sp. VKM Ac-2987]MCZ2860606.1 2TM domain-containing protein [Blastococcus sp. VKM Ac-2987]
MPAQGSVPAPDVLRRRRRFAEHLLAYALVNTVLVVAWLVGALATGAWFPWPLVPLAVWGTALRVHRRAAYARRDEAVRDRG